MNKLTKIFVKDNVFESDVLEEIKQEIKQRKDDFIFNNQNPDYTKWRIYEANQKIAGYVWSSLFNSMVVRKFKEIDDFAFHSISYTNIHTTSITSHINGKPCGWHKNDMIAIPDRINSLNYVIHIDLGNKFTGGNLELSYDNIPEISEGWYPEREPTVHETVDYKDNRIVVFPTHLWHKVQTINTGNKEITSPLDGRLTINGHIGWRL